MSYKLEFTKLAEKTLTKWKKSNPRLYKKTADLLDEIIDHPRTGRGHPEPLVGGGDVTYSRHVSAFDRIVYDIYDDKVLVLIIQLEEHYKDK